jgi:hypothetical protein
MVDAIQHGCDIISAVQEPPMNIPALKLSGVGQLPSRRGQNARAIALRALPRVFHAEGAFLDRQGNRFDLIFGDLRKDPTLPACCFPLIGEIERALEVRFIRRAGRHRCSVWNWDTYP